MRPFDEAIVHAASGDSVWCRLRAGRAVATVILRVEDPAFWPLLRVLDRPDLTQLVRPHRVFGELGELAKPSIGSRPARVTPSEFVWLLGIFRAAAKNPDQTSVPLRTETRIVEFRMVER